MIQSKKDRALEHIKTQIVTGGYRPGQRIVLAAVAQEIGVSTLPVREALMTLAHEGMVTLKPHAGAVVAPVDLPRILEAIKTLAVLEGYATADARRHGNVAQLADTLTRHTDAMVAHRERRAWDAFAAANRSFHHAIYARSDNETLKRTIDRLWDTLDVLLGASTFSFMPQRTEGSIREHRQLIDMLVDPTVDDDRIEAFARRHKLDTGRSFEDQERIRREGTVPLTEGMH